MFFRKEYEQKMDTELVHPTIEIEVAKTLEERKAFATLAIENRLYVSHTWSLIHVLEALNEDPSLAEISLAKAESTYLGCSIYLEKTICGLRENAVICFV